jgi:hypothetical protein
MTEATRAVLSRSYGEHMNDPQGDVGEAVDLLADEDIPQEERFLLWVAAGARCAFCGRYLLENEETGDPVRIGEMAHIVGRKNTKGSPRGLDPLPKRERNKAANLVLVCSNNHTVMDKTRGIEIWETNDLRQLKAEHEAAIKVLTGMTRDRETTVLRVVGHIRGTAPTLSKAVVHEAVHAELRFPQYRLAAVGADVEVDLASNLSEDQPTYFDRTDEILATRVAGHLGAQMASGEISHLSVFGFGRIPVLVQLGHYLDDKWPTTLHQFDRKAGSWKWQATGETPRFDVERVSGDLGSDRVTLVCALSGHPDMDKLPASCSGEGVATYKMHPRDQEPGVNLFSVATAIDTFVDTYLAFLADVERDHPDAEVIDVIPAIGQVASIELGRRRTRAKHPRLRIWDLDDGEYVFATEVGR